VELVFALEFRGKAAAVPGVEGAREAHTMASTAGLVTYIGGDWLRPRVEAGTGEAATLRARVQRFADGTFVEEGRIVYGDVGAIAFETVGRGWVGRRPGADVVAGAVVWRITRGEGGFAGAEGLITSNFSVTDDGAVVDHHFARIYVPPHPS
jgi:hypothetical protein